MSKNRYINTEFWTDPFVMDKLNSDETLLFIYLMTNGRTNVAGIYEISLTTMAVESKLNRQKLPEMLKNLSKKVYYDDGWLVLRNAIKHQNYRNSKIHIAIDEILKAAPFDLRNEIDLPHDYGDLPKKDDSYMTQASLMDESLHVIKYNITKLNAADAAKTKRSASDKPTHPPSRSKPKIAGSKIDQELAAKEQAARTRKPDPKIAHAAAQISSVFGGNK